MHTSHLYGRKLQWTISKLTNETTQELNTEMWVNSFAGGVWGLKTLHTIKEKTQIRDIKLHPAHEKREHKK